MASRGGRISHRRLRKRKYNLACVEDEVSVRDVLSEWLDIVSSDELNSESEGKCPSDESSNTSTESARVRQVYVPLGGKTPFLHQIFEQNSSLGGFAEI
jgi:hypothetical protein